MQFAADLEKKCSVANILTMVVSLDLVSPTTDVIKDDFGGKLPSGRRTSADVVQTSAHVRVYPADAVLSADRFL
jgi:hypothetical protein